MIITTVMGFIIVIMSSIKEEKYLDWRQKGLKRGAKNARTQSFVDTIAHTIHVPNEKKNRVITTKNNNNRNDHPLKKKNIYIYIHLSRFT